MTPAFTSDPLTVRAKLASHCQPSKQGREQKYHHQGPIKLVTLVRDGFRKGVQASVFGGAPVIGGLACAGPIRAPECAGESTLGNLTKPAPSPELSNGVHGGRGKPSRPFPSSRTYSHTTLPSLTLTRSATYAYTHDHKHGALTVGASHKDARAQREDSFYFL